jgi:hypothetical protein
VSNIRLTPALVSYYTKILRACNIRAVGEEIERPKSSMLSTSPVKFLTGFLGGGSTTSLTESTSNPRKHQRTASVLSNAPSLFSGQPGSISRGSSFKNDPPSLNGSFSDREIGRLPMDDEKPENPLMRLEQTFTGYIAGLQGRKGQFIARTLLNRSSADELSVNDLYNRLIESPFDLDATAEVGTDVVFAAFEKFVRIAWRDQMGPIMTSQCLNALQIRASKRVVGDFADFVKFLFGDMAPQNRRAFAALIKLLADLLEGCHNDGDRGALTLAFAELLVDEGNAPDYINLMDRLVEDCDRIFEEPAPGSAAFLRTTNYESLSSTMRSQKSNTGSMTSNTSSLRRKFGLDSLLRQNSKTEPERPSMWRNLSKHGRHPATGESASLSKATAAVRSKSIDMGVLPPGPNRLRRPGSRDRPPVVGAFDDINHRPTSSHQQLETIGEPEVEHVVKETKSLKHKRRSSLSDLKTLMAAATLENAEDTTLMPLRINKQVSEKFNSTPRPVSPSATRQLPPSKIPMSPQAQGLSSMSSIRTPRQKENTGIESPRPKIMSLDMFRPLPERRRSNTVSASQTPTERGHSKTLSTSQIPTLKPPLRITAMTGSSDFGRQQPSTPISPTKSMIPGSPQKFRLQSPQKLRERLQVEKQAVDEVDASLKSELSRIAEDMARVNSRETATPGSVRGAPSRDDVRRLSAAVRALEEMVPKAMSDLEERQAAMRKDMDNTLRATEAKVKAVDQLYKEATAENELMYEKFNRELGKIVKALKGKGREDKEELIAKMKESGEETARVRKENARLKREIISLRTALKGGES